MTNSLRLDVIVPVYRDAPRASEVVRALLGCAVPSDLLLRIRIVDDGSCDDTAAVLVETFGDDIEVVRLQRNLGRSGARNAGARGSDADYLLFLDGDCVPDDGAFLAHHVKALMAADVSIGDVVGQNDGFWHEYQAAASRRRRRLVTRTTSALFTTQNVAIARKSFLGAGGFDEGYVGYGFEDRDLALRLASRGARFVVTPQARVVHRDTLDLATVCRKMREAGTLTSARFASQYPAEYRQLGYEAIDARHHPLRGAAAALTWACVRRLTASDRWLDAPWLPFAAKKLLVRVAVASAYMDGTRVAATNA